ncbi:hypothetical protein [Kribbella albertanoniae]|uniref:hypothetical protein n=1 Tax=Kribbella albertanoniae TaxID=1266829 RepID=UPI00140548BE|nr:hypothetical protein [Kribbella albertanoniae]
MPLAFGDDIDGAVGCHPYGGLVIDRVRRGGDPGRPFLRVGQRRVRVAVVLQVRNDGEVDKPRPLPGDQEPIDVALRRTEDDLLRLP